MVKKGRKKNSRKSAEASATDWKEIKRHSSESDQSAGRTECAQQQHSKEPQAHAEREKDKRTEKERAGRTPGWSRRRLALGVLICNVLLTLPYLIGPDLQMKEAQHLSFHALHPA